VLDGAHPDTATLVGRALPRRPNFPLQGLAMFILGPPKREWPEKSCGRAAALPYQSSKQCQAPCSTRGI